MSFLVESSLSLSSPLSFDYFFTLLRSTQIYANCPQGVDKHGYVKEKKGNDQMQTEKLEIQQGLLVEQYANASAVMRHINKHNSEKEERRRIASNGGLADEIAPQRSKGSEDE